MNISIRGLLAAFFRVIIRAGARLRIQRFRFARSLALRIYSHLKKGGGEHSVQGHRMLLDSGDSLGLSFWGLHEAGTTNLVMRQVKRGDVVLDIGAHIGYFSLVFARQVGAEGRVFAFEPNPDNYALLERNIKRNGYQTVVATRKAVSNTTGKARLYLSPANSGGHNILQPGQYGGWVDVECVRADDYFSGWQGGIDFVKVDVEGAELEAIQGMSSILDSNPNIKLVTEFQRNTWRSIAAAELYLQLLSDHGFRFYRIDERSGSVHIATTYDLLKDIPPEDEGIFMNVFCTRDQEAPSCLSSDRRLELER